MSATEEQTAKALRNLIESLDNIIDQLNTPAFEVAGYELTINGDNDRVNFMMDCAFNLKVGK